MPNLTRRDPSVIDAAPLEVPREATSDGDAQYLDIISDLSSRLEEATAELERIKAKKTVDEVRAGMLEGYSNRVFNFVAIYCGVVGVMIFMAGYTAVTKFRLSDAILSIIAGSTAVSVIGLIGMVITGLFGSSPRAAAKARAKAK